MKAPSRPLRASRWSGAAVLAAWMVVLAAAVIALQTAGGPLGGPPLHAPSSWPEWAAGRDPVVVAFSVVRLVALGAAWYGLVVTVAGVGLRLVSAGRLAAALDRVTLPPLRRLVAAAVTASLSAGALGAAAAGAATTPAAVTVPAPATTTTGAPGDAPPVTLTMHRLAPGVDSPGAPTTVTPAPVDAGPVPPTPAGAQGQGPPARWTVRPGQCFWSVAEEVLAERWGRRPTAAEIVPYWERLVEVNRPTLGDPHNPDLVFPGQVFTLPEVPPG